MEPKPIAKIVHVKQMTLYGILKSGVGNTTKFDSVCIRINDEL